MTLMNGNEVDLKKSTSFDPYSGGLYLTLYEDIYKELIQVYFILFKLVLVF